MRRARRSIIHDAPNRFQGWDRILELYERALALDKEKNTNQYSLYFVTIFETGGRKSEVVLLTPQQIQWNDEAIVVERMEVLKRRKRVTRQVIIKIDENPLAQPFIEMVEQCNTDYLRPSRTPYSGNVVYDKYISSTSIYEKIVAIDPGIWPHWIRDQRSWHLSDVRGLDPYELKTWFEWGSIEMPAHYAGRRMEKEMKIALGIEELPSAQGTMNNNSTLP